jgi:hypothetical protein
MRNILKNFLNRASKRAGERYQTLVKKEGGAVQKEIALYEGWLSSKLASTNLLNLILNVFNARMSNYIKAFKPSKAFQNARTTRTACFKWILLISISNII